MWTRHVTVTAGAAKSDRNEKKNFRNARKD